MRNGDSVAIGAILAALAWPVAGLAIGMALLALQLTLMGARLGARLGARRPCPGQARGAAAAGRSAALPVFSVHVATHDEPPDLVIRTLRSLLRQDWPCRNHEIVVLDNNTADPALWRPVEAFCAAAGPGIRFFHHMGVRGAKAGALNLALERTRPDATHIVTVDADYQVQPDFLSRAAAALARTGADYVQFPQAYRGVTGAVRGVDAELKEYFGGTAAVADGAEAVLLTGTLCVIARPALVAAGGWSGATTTEDAELGVRLCRTGHRGRFIDQVAGRGLLPLALADLERQRYRWCSGNVQTLRRHLPAILSRRGGMDLPVRLAVLSQLTAWVHLGLIPAGLLLSHLALGRAEAPAVPLAAAVLLLGLADSVARILGRGRQDRPDPATLIGALACRLALAPQSARATLDALSGQRTRFVVTDKSGTRSGPGARGGFGWGFGWGFGGRIGGRAAIPWAQLVLFATALPILLLAPPHQPAIRAALMTLMLPLPAALWIRAGLNGYRRTALRPALAHGPEVPA